MGVPSKSFRKVTLGTAASTCRRPAHFYGLLAASCLCRGKGIFPSRVACISPPGPDVKAAVFCRAEGSPWRASPCHRNIRKKRGLFARYTLVQVQRRGALIRLEKARKRQKEMKCLFCTCRKPVWRVEFIKPCNLNRKDGTKSSAPPQEGHGSVC